MSLIKILCSLLICFLCVFVAKAQGQPPSIIVDKIDKTYKNLNSSIFIVEDRTKKQSFEEIKKDTRFKPFDSLKVLSYYFAYWGKMEFKSKLLYASNWSLETGGYDFVEVYVCDQNNNCVLKKTGYGTPLSQKDLPTENAWTSKGLENAVALTLPPNSHTTVYLKYYNQSPRPIELMLNLMPRPIFDHKEISKHADRNLQQGFFQGAVFILLIYHLLIFLANRDKAYLFYSYYLLATAINMLNRYHYFYHWFLGDYPYLHHYIHLFSLGFLLIFYFHFLESFLGTENFDSKIKNLVIWLRRVLYVSLVVDWWIFWGLNDIQLYRDVTNILYISIAFVILYILFTLTKHRRTEIVYFTAGSFFFFTIFIVTFIFNFMSWKINSGNMMQLAAIVEFMLFAFGLGNRMRSVEKDKQNAQKELINQLLENKKMELRTSSEMRRANDELKTTLEELDTFVYRSSHDLQGPLVRLKGLLLVAKQESKDGVAHFYLDKLFTESNNLESTLKKLTMINVINQNLEEEQVNVKKIIQEIHQELLIQLAEHNVRLIYDFKDNVMLPTDHALFKIVLHNLIENAIHFRKNNYETVSKVLISQHQNEKHIFIDIKDEGIGIAQELQIDIFKMFFRGTEQSKGNGLGLYIAKKAIEKMGGKIRLESTVGKDSFTTFSVILPQ